MQFVGKESIETIETPPTKVEDGPIVFFDVEVYPNLFVVCWKAQGSNEVVRMINPNAQEVEQLFQMKLVGFNNRRYDNHILYARYLNYSNEGLYDLSQKIISGDNNKANNSVLFAEAYNLSYADIYDFSSKKQGLKKFEIELGIHHMELDIPWDEPVDESLWQKVVDYCANDVVATEAVFENRMQDFIARQILSELSGLSVNHTTQNQTARIIFGEEKNPQAQFKYTDLSEMFPGYSFDGKESTYRGEVTGEGGYVYAEPGIYENVALLDVVSMHPTSIELLEAFGPYTPRYSELKEARVAIKRKEYDRARTLLDGKLVPFLTAGEDVADDLAYALKIVINIVYGLTSARFPNAFKDPRNHDNIVAKRGALFMIDLKHAVQEKGFTVAHIKTDSIKIPEATPEIIEFVTEFGKKYGYEFEHEGTYDRFCLINDAVYIARENGKWTAVGAQFQHSYVYKKLFTGEEITFNDLCETKNVTQGSMYMDFNESELRQVSDHIHVGRTGSFVPVKHDGATLLRVKDDKKYAVTGTKGYRWLERDRMIDLGWDQNYEAHVDFSYFDKLVRDAEAAIEYYGSFQRFVS
jgi:DNA polymerase elongation subunit (family B)